MLKAKSIASILKIFLFFTFAFLLLIFTPIQAFAQSTSASPSANFPPNIYTLPPVISSTSPMYTDFLVYNLFHSFSCLAVGQSAIGQPCLSYQWTKNTQGMLQSIPVLSSTNLSGGALGATSSLIAMLYANPPIRTTDYLASIGINLGIVKEAHAQVAGSGSTVLSPVINLWQASRNISYVIIIIIFVVIGLMIIFRSKLNPQTIITAQAAIPGLIIGLILITFSYFFASLLSDFSFLGTNVIGYYFWSAQGSTGNGGNPQDLVSDLQVHNVFSIVGPFTGIVDTDNATGALRSIWGSFRGNTPSVLQQLAMFFTAQFASSATEVIRAIPTSGQGLQVFFTVTAVANAAADPAGIVGLALAFVATLVLIYAMFQLLLRLISTYLTIIFLTITAPFHFLAAALPGRQEVATNWVLNMLAHILAFPAVLAVLYFVAYLLGPNFVGQNCPAPCPFEISQTAPVQQPGLISTAYADPPKSAGSATPRDTSITDSGTFPLFGGLNIRFLNIILAFGALVALPAIPEIINRAIGKLSQAGQMIGQEISGSVGAGRGFAGQYQRGIGGLSQQGAQARGLFDTPNYQVTGWKDGKPIISQHPLSGTSAGAFSKLFGRRGVK